MYAIESNGVRYEAKTAQEVVELFNLHKDTDAYRAAENERMQEQIREFYTNNSLFVSDCEAR